MMQNAPYAPVFELSRGETVESIHYGAIAIVDANGKLLASFGDPYAVTFLRSSAKPFQILPFLTHGGQAHYNLSSKEIAVMCASHSGTDEHFRTIQHIQERAALSEQDLLCGVHPPLDPATAEALRVRQEEPTPNRHNCSGKHTGMLAFARMIGSLDKEIPYINPEHPIQRQILETLAYMCDLPSDQIHRGVDGCSAPNFAVPLYNCALAYARLSDPENGQVEPMQRRIACHMITSAMMENPFMVGGPERLDTRLMEVAHGKLICKGGAEGYEGIGLMPGTLFPNSPGIGIALKIADGDGRPKVRPAVVLEVLRQLGVLTPGELDDLSQFGPSFPIYNWRNILVGRGHPNFELVYAS